MEDLARLARIFQYLRCLVQKVTYHIDHTLVELLLDNKNKLQKKITTPQIQTLNKSQQIQHYSNTF